MDVRQTLICFFFFTLRGRNTGLINADIIGREGTEGGDVTVACEFNFSGIKKIFCKQPCEEGDILIETEDVTAESGRYSIVYTEGLFPLRSSVLYVSITKLTKSDAGKYRCGFERSLLSSYHDIEIRVEEAPISSKPNVTLQPLPASVPSASTQTTTQLSSSTGSYTPSSASPEGTQQSQREQTPAAGVLLYVRLTLVIMIIVLSTAVLIICRKRASEPKEPSVEAVYANITEANRVSEEIREEDEESRTPFEMSAV